MSTEQIQFPHEVLMHIFVYTQSADIVTCFYVFRAWYAPAKHYCHRDIEFIRFSFIRRFITCMQSDPDQSNLFMEKITFTCNDLDFCSPFHIFTTMLEQLRVLCPHVQTLAALDPLKPIIIDA
jgi:hypothetical protein